MPEISIIVPVYNVEPYLCRCVDSILAQTFTDFELILIDDGSPDNCPAICDEYARRDKRVSVLHSLNAGLSSARNSGLALARGAYIGFVDSDDWICSDMYEYLHSLIKRTGADVVSADYVFSDGTEASFSSAYKENEIEGAENILSFYLMQDKLHGKNDFPVWIKLYKRELFGSIKFPSGRIYEDNITNFKILSGCKKYVKSTKQVYAYFQRPQSTTKTRLTERHLALIDVSKEMLALSKDSVKLQNLCRRKIAMSYFSVLALYVRYGTDLDFTEIKRLVSEYKVVKQDFLKTKRSPFVHILSAGMCIHIKLLRRLYVRFVGLIRERWVMRFLEKMRLLIF